MMGLWRFRVRALLTFDPSRHERQLIRAHLTACDGVINDGTDPG
jgi:hypothetical protein